MATTEKILKKASTLMIGGKFREAGKLYRKVLTQEPNNVTALYNRGIILHKSGDTQGSLAPLRQTVSLARDFPEAYLSLASVEFELGKLDEAAVNFRTAVRLNPRLERAYFRLGNILETEKEYEQAAAYYQKSIALRPNSWENRFAFGRSLFCLNRFSEALPHIRDALRLDPNQQESRRTLGECLRYIKLTEVSEGMREDIIGVLSAGVVEPQSLSTVIISALRCDAELDDFFALNGDDEVAIEKAWDSLDKGAALPGMVHPLLLQALKSVVLGDVQIERGLTTLRKLLLEAVEQIEPELLEQPTYLQFLSALGYNCFNNEYIFFESEHEASMLERLQQRIQTQLEYNGVCPSGWVALLASYRPLYKTPFARTLLDSHWPEDICALLNQQVKEPLIEESLRSGILSLTHIQDEVSLAVREQYEENPYPRWHSYLHNACKPASPSVVMHQLFPYTKSIKLPNPEKLKTLIAGCGTGRHAFAVAERFKNADVLAVDLSKASLAYAIRMAEQLDTPGIQFRQADILKLGELDQTFDLIESCGVLHHMYDPVAAWRILIDSLRSGGLMKIALYSEYARHSVVAARRIIAEQGYGSTAAEIRRLRQNIIAGEAVEDLSQLFSFKDFFSMSESRDLLFHVQEHRYTLMQLKQIIGELKLEFLGFEFSDKRSLDLYKERFPEDTTMTSLDNWHQFELEYPYTFVRMYQMWFKKSDD